MAKIKTPQSSSGKRTDLGSETGKVGGDVHPTVIRAATVASVWFVIAMAISFSGTIEADYLLGVVVGFSVIFFTLILGLAAHAASHTGGRAEPAQKLADFLQDEVAIDSGSISGREAMVQILTLPITLAIGATIIGFIFVIGA